MENRDDYKVDMLLDSVARIETRLDILLGSDEIDRLARIERKLDEMKIAISGAAQLASDGEAIGMLATNRIESKLDDMLYKCDECGQMTQHRGQLNYCLTCEGLREQALEDRMHEVRR